MKYLLRKHSYIILALIPLVYLVFFVVQYKVSFPVEDEWDLVPLLEKSYQGALSFPDFWEQHNEHRPFFPRMIMTIFARLSGWNISYELAINILLAIGIFAAIVYQIKITAKSIGGLKINWIIPIISLMVFSLSQWENWFSGWQMQIFLNVLASVTGIVLLSSPVFRWPYFLAALLSGIVATYSFANGIIYWFIGLLILLFYRKTRRLSVILWAVAGLIVAFSYLYKYEKPSDLPSYGVIFEQPLEYIKYVFCYLGSPLASFSKKGAFLFGLSGFILPVYLTWVSLRFRHIKFGILIPYIALSLYAIASALITGIGRAGFPTRQALSPRYITISSLFWISNIIFLFLLAGRDGDISNFGKWINFKKYILSYGTKIIIFSLIINSVYGSIVSIRRYYLSPPEKALLSGSDHILKRLYGSDADWIKGNLGILKKFHLSIFRKNS